MLTSGGDAPGMNAAVRAVVRTAIANNMRVMEFAVDMMALIHGDIFPMNLRSVSILFKMAEPLYSLQEVLLL